jgi:DNA-binding XRE family transcriptional regulator
MLFAGSSLTGTLMLIITLMKLGANVKSARRRRFMTQEQLAKAAGISQRTLVNIETDKVEPHFSTILKLAEALGVDPIQLVDDQ